MKSQPQPPEKPLYSAHRERLRERFRQTKGEGLSDYELLELLLTYAIPRRDIKPTAKALLKKFKKVKNVLSASAEQLQMVPGMGPISSLLIELVRKLLVISLKEELEKKDLLSSPKAVVDFARLKLVDYPYEALMIIYLNVKNEFLESEILQEGTINSALVYPRKIVEKALQKKAAGILLIHNHPSGYCSPSREDKKITQLLAKTVKALDISLLDHLIIGEDGYFSFLENGLLGR
jgi:DNA repair protein RadC